MSMVILSAHQEHLRLVMHVCIYVHFSFTKHISFFFFFCLFAFSRAAPEAYEGSQARGRIGAVATGLRQSHSNSGSEPRLQPIPQLTATLDP